MGGKTTKKKKLDFCLLLLQLFTAFLFFYDIFNFTYFFKVLNLQNTYL